MRFCDRTRGHVPVHADRSPGAPVVGPLERGGAGERFVAEMKDQTFRDGSAENCRWASTRADNANLGALALGFLGTLALTRARVRAQEVLAPSPTDAGAAV